MPQTFDVVANESARNKRNELECKFEVQSFPRPVYTDWLHVTCFAGGCCHTDGVHKTRQWYGGLFSLGIQEQRLDTTAVTICINILDFLIELVITLQKYRVNYSLHVLEHGVLRKSFFIFCIWSYLYANVGHVTRLLNWKTLFLSSIRIYSLWSVYWLKWQIFEKEEKEVIKIKRF